MRATRTPLHHSGKQCCIARKTTFLLQIKHKARMAGQDDWTGWWDRTMGQGPGMRYLDLPLRASHGRAGLGQARDQPVRVRPQHLLKHLHTHRRHTRRRHVCMYRKHIHRKTQEGREQGGLQHTFCRLSTEDTRNKGRVDKTREHSGVTASVKVTTGANTLKRLSKVCPLDSWQQRVKLLRMAKNI